MIKLAQLSNFQHFGMIPLNFNIIFKQVNSKKNRHFQKYFHHRWTWKGILQSYEFSLRFDTNTGWYDQKLIPAQQPCFQPMET
jgi:hypothetical protein